MSDSSKHRFALPPEQQAIRDKCFHPSGRFVKFPLEDVETSIPARFEKIVRQHGDRIAVITETGVVTYNQLNSIANRFARALLQRQGSRGQVIALLFEKEVAQVAAMLGVMKAGKFFLILDPTFPKTRLTAMLKGSRAKLVVTNGRNAALANEILGPDCQLIQWEAVDGSLRGDNPGLAIAPKALAFINYTSGSTGEPKGLLRSHRMILHNIMLRTNLVHICEQDRISLLSSGTSNAITNSLLALLNGAGLYSFDIKNEGVARLSSWLHEQSITVAPMSSPLFRNLCETLKGNRNFPDLRVLRLRSESVFKLDLEHYKQFFRPECIFVTGLSSNETGPLADYLVDHDTVAADDAVPVGYPAPGKEILLLNQDGEPIGSGEIGEIAVRSRYLCPGYLRNSRLTKAKFKRDPSETGSRLYLTGDMGLRLSDGCLIHKGRKDFRVKVRGYPVDLKEVEIALRAHPRVQDCVVTARTNQAGETIVIAHFVTVSQQAPTVSELVRFLEQTIADYMIPAKFVRLERMPLNPQNKVDRPALPPPAETRPELDTPFMAPRDDEESKVAEIWAEVLGIDRVGIHDNFFDLGGHSLAATRIVTRVIDKFHLELPLQVLFDAPTVAKMATVITGRQSVDHQRGKLLSQQSSDAVKACSTGATIDLMPFTKEDVERSIPERFEKIVRMHPDRIAVKTGKEIVTYAQLNAMANRMAHAIVEQRGTAPEAIAILIEKGPRLMAGMLAVLKAGKYFILLDSSSPNTRNKDLLEDSLADLVISDRDNALIAGDITNKPIRWLEFDSLDLNTPTDNLDLYITPDAFAAVAYTSGSTGGPKGVIWNHEDLLHRAMLRTIENQACLHDRIALLTTGTANTVTNSLFALLNGAILCPFAVQREGVVQLAKWLSEEGITICPFSSSLFRSFTAALTGREKFPEIRIVRLRSETVHKSDLELFKKFFPIHCAFVTGLSSSETGQLTTHHLDHDSDIPDAGVPIGHPMPDKEVLLLDDAGEEVGVNQVGEIVVRSRYLAVGYWRRPELTAAKFRPDPNKCNQRLCFTGDLGLRLPNGCLVHKGRKDFRFKIRGYGVELAEVERNILSYSGVKEAVVIARQNGSGDTRLVAYYTGASDPPPRSKNLREFLEEKLPLYMVPASFILLDSMPLTLNGKLDRRALPDLDHSRPDLNCCFVPPRSDLESDLAKIWGQVLGLDQVGIHDNFFDLGGHSLAATRIVTRVIEQFNLELPLQVLFNSPTIEKMAAVIGEPQSVGHKPGEHGSKQSNDAVQARPLGTTTDFTPFPKADLERSIPERFEKIVHLYPDQIAIQTVSAAVTYCQLNAMANRVARRIISERGTVPEPVGLLFDKGVEQLAAMLGILKAGKFFVLFDPSFPLDRNLAIYEETSPPLILVDAKNMQYGSKLTNTTTRLVVFESLDPNSASNDPKLAISPDSLALVVYTSGSTGKPKGVIQTHRNTLHMVMLHSNLIGLTPDDRCALLTSGTNNTIGNSLLALLGGAALHPLNVHELGFAGLTRRIIGDKLSICAMSVPLFRQFCASLTGKDKFPDLKVLRLTSEASYKSDFELYKQFFPRTCRLANLLSPTESGILSQIMMDHDTQIAGPEMPLGYADEDTGILLLDDDGREVGYNKVGEIVVRSRYLSPGYWCRPELTKKKFKADPQDPTKRLYYTGDLGLMVPDGCLFHKGRKDFRVKIRGYGVETFEVEKALRGHASIRECVVIDQKNESGEAKLVAFYTAAAQTAPSASVLRAFLIRCLPDYMIPSAFVKLETIPLTPNGKLDRHALPEPGGHRPEIDVPYLAPESEIEKAVSRIFSECAGIERVGLHDNFFELGGDSLLFTRLLSRVSVRFQREFSIQELFEAPSVAGIARLLESPTQPAVVDAEPSLSLISQDTPAPLSYSQQRLWFLDQLDPGSYSYNLFAAYQLKGNLNVEALEQSFNEIIRRHEVLRTVFQLKNGNPIQVVIPNLTINMPLVDLRALASEATHRTEVRRMFTDEAQRPFDLATGPLVRITLLQLADDEYILLRAIHHIVCDGWSGGVLFHELSEIYGALLAGQPLPLADLTTQYGDYAKWQRQWFQDERLESQLSYWKKQLDNIATLRLPTDRPRPGLQARSGARRYFAFSDALSSELKKLSREHGATLFMTLLAAFQTLLHRYSHQTDIVIGSPVAGRTRKEFDELIGFFLNMLVLRLDLSADPTFAETIAQARDICLAALSHQELPFEKLVEELHPDRKLGHNPLFQVSFAFQNTPRFPLRLSGMTVEELEVETGIARFDLHLFMEEADKHLEGYCDYDANLFNADTIERLLGHFQTLLEGIVANPDQRISDLPLLGDAEKHQLLVEWNDTQTDYPNDKSIHQLFEAQVEKSPDAIAVAFEDQQLTYRELNSRANQLAHYLRKQGVQPDSIVGLCMNGSVELVIAILGVLKAGGAYMPIDPELPAQRLQFLLEDAQVRLLLTQDKLRSALADFAGHIVCLDGDWHELADQSHENPQHYVRGHHAAYVIYTSGSTGNPKGVVNVHDGLRNRIQWMQESYRLSSADRVLQKTPFTFDVSVWEFLWPLISGAGLVVARPGGHRDSSYLVQLIQSQQITTLHFVPSMLELFLQQPGVERCASLRQVICSGEALSYELQKRFFGRSTARLHNLYGPTEASIDVTAWECRKDSDLRIVPIGYPIANTQIHILDVNLQPVPVGVWGELHIGGVGLSRGYLNRPELTPEKFIPNPFSDDPGSRLYRSGDLARYLPDGNIEFRGRIDDQVKIRGYRIELGEIESILAQHSAIQQAAVIAREDNPGDKRLAAYVVTAHDSAPSAHDLRSALQRKLPDYMVPSVFVFLDTLPLTPNGKLDRKALPAPDHSRPELENTFTAPRTPVETRLANIWAEVLKLDQVGIHDNFFHLGGHSLLATQVVSRIRAVMDIDLPLRRIFESPTVAETAMLIAAHQSRDPSRSDLTRILPELEAMTDEEALNILAE